MSVTFAESSRYMTDFGKDSCDGNLLLLLLPTTFCETVSKDTFRKVTFLKKK